MRLWTVIGTMLSVGLATTVLVVAAPSRAGTCCGPLPPFVPYFPPGFDPHYKGPPSCKHPKFYIGTYHYDELSGILKFARHYERLADVGSRKSFRQTIEWKAFRQTAVICRVVLTRNNGKRMLLPTSRLHGSFSFVLVEGMGKPIDRIEVFARPPLRHH